VERRSANLLAGAAFALTLLQLTPAAGSAAQEPAAASRDEASIRERLRALYFNLGRRDWVALEADVLPAKILASRSAPGRLPAAAVQPGSAAPPDHDAPTCSTPDHAAVDRATIVLEGGWADVSVPRCTGAAPRVDAFRLVRFGGRWRFVYIDVSGPEVSASDRGAGLR
jgi:hypothetical protein